MWATRPAPEMSARITRSPGPRMRFGAPLRPPAAVPPAPRAPVGFSNVYDRVSCRSRRSAGSKVVTRSRVEGQLQPRTGPVDRHESPGPRTRDVRGAQVGSAEADVRRQRITGRQVLDGCSVG